MPGRVVLITSGKGGVGKTTIIANVGAALASTGKRVALVDANFGLRGLDVALGLEGSVDHDLADVASGACSLDDAMVHDERFGELYLVPAPRDTEIDAQVLDHIATLADELVSDFDYVLLDAPNGHDTGFKAALAAADEAVLVATPEVSTISNVSRTLLVLREAGVPVTGVILNRVHQKMVKRGDMLTEADISELIPVPIVGVVRETVEVAMAVSRGEPMAGLEGSSTARTFSGIAAWLDGGETAPATHEDRSFFGRLGQLFRIQNKETLPPVGAGTSTETKS